MKLLVVGIDGGTSAIFDAFDMPFWKSLRERDVTFDVTEDLNQRGWARMLSGKGAEETRGVYMRPMLDNSRQFDISFNYKTMSEAPGFVPIWALAEQAGARVGMMNVPTTSPAQTVNGFYISGGGGGIFQGGLPENSVYPDRDRQILLDEGYIFDTRLGAEGFEDKRKLCAHIIQMMQIRTKTLVRMSKKNEIDFGFVAYRATTVLLYLAMAEIAHIMRLPPDHADRDAWSTPWLDLVNAHMKALDDTLAELFDELQPEHHIIVSDHSIVPWTHNVDFNGFLVEEKFAHRSASTGRLIRNSARAILRPKARQVLGQVPLAQLYRGLTTGGATLDPEPRAFSGGYVYGIYVNDADRFGGPVAEAELVAETDRIVESFNWKAQREGVTMRAAPYRRTFSPDATHGHVLPDVTILQDGHAFPTSNIGRWYTRNSNFGPVKSVKGVGGMHSGQKGPNPILMANPALAKMHDPSHPVDLRSVHHLTAQLFRSGT